MVPSIVSFLQLLIFKVKKKKLVHIKVKVHLIFIICQECSLFTSEFRSSRFSCCTRTLLQSLTTMATPLEALLAQIKKLDLLHRVDDIIPIFDGEVDVGATMHLHANAFEDVI